MDFKTELNEKISKVDIALNKWLPKEKNLQSIIYEAAKYSIFAGGKRIRPVIMLSVCEMCGGDSNIALPFACAIEMIHTYSLIHDDLPAMDNDELRRGKPTSHIKFGEGIAILTGDALLNRAFEVMSDATVTDVPSKSIIKVINTIACSSGADGMIGGQVVDIESESKPIDLDTLRYIHARKTGEIIRSSAVSGAILAGADEQAQKAVDDFALYLGMAFQIRDDILDVVGDEKTLGKPIGSDCVSEKTTYITLLGMDNAQALVSEYSEKAKAALFMFGEKTAFLCSMIDYLVGRNN